MTTATRDRRPALLVAAAILAVVVVGLVVTVGVARPPQLASIDDDPVVTPPAAVAVHGWDDGDFCVTIVEADGTSRRPWCSSEGADLVGWEDRGVVLETYGADVGDLRLIVDPDDGEVVGTEPRATDGYGDGRHRSEVTTSRAGDGDLEVRLEDGTLLWRTAAPESYEVTGGWRSPDGGSVALLDNADRLLLIPADGGREPRVWAEDVGGRYDVAWEGRRAAR